MTKYLFLLFFSCIAHLCLAQKELDSLLSELKKQPQEDTVRLKLLLKVAFAYNNINPNKGIGFAMEAIAMAKKLDKRRLQSVGYIYLAQNYQTLGKDSIAIGYCRESLVIKKQLKDSLGIGMVYHTIGMSYFARSEYDKALENEEQAFSIFKQLKDTARQAIVLNSLGVDNQYMGNYPKALAYYQQAFTIGKAKGDETLQASALTNMGLVFNNMAEYNKALNYHNKASAIYRRSGDSVGLSNSYGNIGNVYDLIGDTVISRKYYRQALQVAKTAAFEFGIASAIANMGISYIHTSEYLTAFPYLQKALQKFTALNDRTNIASMLDYLSTLYIKAPPAVLKKLNIPALDRFAKAEQMQLQSIGLSTQTRHVQELSAGYDNLSRIYDAQKEYTKAYRAYKQAVLYKDSLLNDSKKRQITRLEMQYEFSKTQDSIKAITDKQQAIAKAAMEKQQIVNKFLMAGTGFLLITGFAGFLMYKRNRDISIKRKEAELKVLVAETEMKALRAQMNPHFIFNSLNSINDYIDKHDSETATLFTTKFAKLMRRILENSEQKEIILSNELQTLELYMQLEAMRLQNGFVYEIKVDEHIDMENTLIPPLLLQPFLENSILHGITKKKEGKIILHIQKEGNMLNCTIEDNGVGMLPDAWKNEKQPERKSFGTKITQDRINIINKIKKLNGKVELKNLIQGTRAEVTLPFETAY